MIRFRFWLARKLIGSRNLAFSAQFGAKLLTDVLQRTRADYFKWRTSSGRRYIVGEIDDEEADYVYATDCECNICTAVFEAFLDEPVRCPHCGSLDVIAA